MFDARHALSRGQVGLDLQLQGGEVTGFAPLVRVPLLCALIFCFRFGKKEKLSFRVFLLKIFFSGWSLLNVSSTMFRNIYIYILIYSQVWIDSLLHIQCSTLGVEINVDGRLDSQH